MEESPVAGERPGDWKAHVGGGGENSLRGRGDRQVVSHLAISGLAQLPDKGTPFMSSCNLRP